MSANPLDHLEPTDADLLRMAFQNVDDSMLREIAAADYGMDVEEHLEQLRAIKNGKVPTPMEWEPKEVLELIRWSEPEDATWSPGSTGRRGHWMRLFSCAALLRAAAEPENDGYFTGEDSTIIQLVDSAVKLGEKTSLVALKFLCWRMQYRTLDEWDRPYFAIAILLLSVFLDKCDPDTTKYLITVADSGQWRLPELYPQCQKAKTWNDLTRRILIESRNSTTEVEKFGEILTRNVA